MTMGDKKKNIDELMDSRGRDQEFIRLLLNNQNRLYGYILSLLPNPTDVDDIMQETATIMWRRFDDFEPGTNFAGWAIKIAYHRILKLRARQTRTIGCFSDKALEELSIQSPAVMETMDERLEALQQCVGRLKEHDRHVIRIRYQSEGSLRQVAEQLGRSADGFYKTMTRIHRMLQDCVRRKLTHWENL